MGFEPEYFYFISIFTFPSSPFIFFCLFLGGCLLGRGPSSLDHCNLLGNGSPCNGTWKGIPQFRPAQAQMLQLELMVYNRSYYSSLQRITTGKECYFCLGASYDEGVW